jgi:hypothetical protein
VTSARKIESNKSNASRSTGPRTPGGKLRSRNNSRRHGLATRVEDAPEVKGSIDRLTAILAEGTDDFERAEQARSLAECHFDLRRIRAARFDVFLTMDDLENATAGDFEKALGVMASISRYQTRALSKNRRALRKSRGA